MTWDRRPDDVVAVAGAAITRPPSVAIPATIATRRFAHSMPRGVALRPGRPDCDPEGQSVSCKEPFSCIEGADAPAGLDQDAGFATSSLPTRRPHTVGSSSL